MAGLCYEKLNIILIVLTSMCLSPIKIKNVNYGSTNPLLRLLKRDTTHAFMEVPCGHCEQCVSARQNDFVQRIEAESKYNHLFFATLTYDNDHLPRISVDVPVVRPGSEDSESRFDLGSVSAVVPIAPIDSRDSDEYLSLDAFDLVEDSEERLAGEAVPDSLEYETVTFAYADIHDIQLMVKNVRDNNPLDGRCIRYVCVSELGKQNGRPHFHVLFLVEKRPEDFNSLGQPIAVQLRTLESRLRTCVMKYWAENIGTRKNPIYVPRFKYARRWSFGKVYTNFDLHWVDPSKTTDQTANVAYYVSKYMMKGSDRDSRRQQFLRLNLSEDEYEAVWKVIKCRMTCSKGLGLDARYETIEDTETLTQYMPLWKYVETIDSMIQSDDEDLPDFDQVKLVTSVTHVVKRRRVLVPNFELAQKIRQDLSCDLGKSPGPIFIDPKGNHRPLSHYYQRHGFIFTPLAAIEIVMNYDLEKQPPTKELADAADQRLDRRRRIVDSHSSFDNCSTVDMPDNDPTLKTYIY